ncbi:MAG: hypothetical protein ACKOWF_11270, partial [Chloroflexota bacterium]
MPSLADSEAAMREPSRLVPAVDALGGGALAIDGAGGLWSVAGRSSVMYALRRPDGRILALRVPLADGRAAKRYAEPYAAAASDPLLAPLRMPGGTLPARLQVLPEGLVLDGGAARPRFHPIVAGEYLAGGTLGLAARGAALAGDRPALHSLFASLADLLARNDGLGFEHGALGPETVLLRDDGSLATPNLGTAAWPGSPAGPASRGRDRLPALLLLAELAALAADPSLLLPEADWQHLVLSAEDLADPRQSAVLASLAASGDPACAALAALAAAALASRDAPPLAATLAAARGRPAAGSPGPAAGSAPA